MKENKYEELLFLSAIGEICEPNSIPNPGEYICFKPNKFFSVRQVLCLTSKNDERDCVIETRLTAFQKKIGLSKVVDNGSGRIRLKSFALGYLVEDKKLTEITLQNILSNFNVLVENNVISVENAMNLFVQFKGYVTDCRKAYDKQTSEDL